MALPKCPNQNCPSNKTTSRAFFEFFQDTPIGSNHPIYLIQCSKCGTVIGYKDIKHTQYFVEELIDTTNKILARISMTHFDTSLSEELYTINQNLKQILSLLKLDKDMPTPFDTSLSEELYTINQNLKQILSLLKLDKDMPTESPK